MPNKIKPKRSYTTNSVPLTTDLEAHELAINWADGVAYTKNASGQIVSVPLGGSGGGGGGISWASAPASATATGTAGQIAYDSNYLYIATATNTWKRAALSTWAQPVITITSQPTNQTASSGGATFSVAATVTQGAELSYQWQKQESGAGSFADVSGATSSSLVLAGLIADDNGDVYRCVVSATGGAQSVTSDSATLTVPSGPPQSLTVSGVPGAYASSFNGTYPLQGQTADGRYWYRMTTNSDYGGFKNISYFSGFSAWVISVGNGPYGNAFFFGPENVADSLPPSSGYVTSNNTGGYGNATNIAIS